MNLQKLKFVAFGAALALLAGCAPAPAPPAQPAVLTTYGTTGRPLDTGQVKRIRIGHTTRGELLALFGQPTNVTEMDGSRTTLMWVHSSGGSATSMGFPAASATQMNIQVLSVQLSHGKVAYYTFSPGNGIPINAGAIAR